MPNIIIPNRREIYHSNVKCKLAHTVQHQIVGDYDAGLDYGVPSGLMGLLQIQGGKSGSRVIVLPGGHIRGLAQLWDALEPRAITMDGCTV